MGVELKPSDFVHLHNHTHHSLLDGLTKIPDLVERVKNLGMEAVAITDHGTMAGVFEMYKTATEAGVKPILGMEAYVAARSRHDRDPAKDKPRYHLTMLAMNNKGYQNLMRLSTIADLEGKYYKPRIDHEIIEKYNEGLIILSGCAGGEVAERLKLDDYSGAVEVAQWYQSIFGDRYYLEMQDHGHPESPSHWDVQNKVNNGLVKISKELDIPLVVSNDGHYLTLEDQEAHEILLCVGTGAYLTDEKRMSLADFQLYVTDPRDIIKRWGKEYPEAILNTKKIADRCNVELELGRMLIPVFPTPNGENEKEYLDLLVYQGLARRFGSLPDESAKKLTIEKAKKHLSKEVLDRAEYELKVIDGMGFNGYFLIVQDFVNWGKSQGIIFGPGRGSAAGSIIAYGLNITDLDPIKYGLLFERFLNPDRISMPDIDIDIQDTRRDEVVQYCSNKYGEDRVSNIVTFGTMAARGAVRDVGRVLQFPYAESDRLAKLVPPPVQGRHIPLKVSVEENADLKKAYQSTPAAKEVLDYAMRLEGTIRSHGVHACGVVIAPDELVKYVPLEYSQKGVVTTQFSMGQIEELGLLKMDFLGLSNLTIIKNTLRIIKKLYGETISLATLPLDDKKTYELLQRGDTTGVFQFESSGMKRYLRDLKPTQFDDIIAMGALYRPGPLSAGLTDSYVKRKNNLEDISYPHPLMEAALKPTFGVLVYQEQVMQISRDVCSFTGGEADTLRKAVGKKKIDVMQKMQVKFIDGAVKNGVPKDVIEKFWHDLLGFADYCFNKSHSACYGMISYWTAYLKAHYPEAFMAALMTSDHGDIDRLAIEISECKRVGIKVLLPDVNEGFVEFAVVPDKREIRFGMDAVKGVGTAAVEEVIRAREEGGEFKSVEDFAKRVSNSKFNRKAWESLVKAGGFDSLGDRSDILFNLDTIIAFASKFQKDANSGQIDLFSVLGEDSAVRSTLKLQPAPTKYTDSELLMWERELMGLYISSHPLDNYDTYFEEQTISLSTIKVENDGEQVTVGGLLTRVRTILTKNGSKMAFVGVEDKTGESEIIVFPNLYEQLGENLTSDKVAKVVGKVNARDRNGELNGEPKIIADRLEFITDEELKNYESTGSKVERKPVKKQQPKVRPKTTANSSKKQKPVSFDVVDESAKKIYIYVKNPDDLESLEAMKREMMEHYGNNEVILVLGEKKDAIRLPFKIQVDENLINSISDIFGKDCVVVK